MNKEANNLIHYMHMHAYLLYRLFKNGRHCDFIIQCGDQQFDVHKAILYGRCGWFKETIEDIGEVRFAKAALEPYLLGAVYSLEGPAHMLTLLARQVQPPEQGQLPVIEVTGHEPIDVEAILIFIYSGGTLSYSKLSITSIYHPSITGITAHNCIEIDPSFFPDEAYPSSCVRLYNLGHIFQVTNLADFATNELGNYLSNVLKSICDQRLWAPANDKKVNRRTEIQDRLRRANFMSNYLAAVERADRVRLTGATETDRLRPYQMLIDFFIAGEALLLAEPEFELWLESDVVPSFAKSVLLTRKKGGCRSRWMLSLVSKPPTSDHASASRQCVDCHTSLKNTKQCSGVGFVNPRSWKGAYTQAMCKVCLDKEKNQGQDGFPLWEVFSRQED